MQAGRALSYDNNTDPDTLNADIATETSLGVVSVGEGLEVSLLGELSTTPVEIPPGTIISETAPADPEAGQLWWADTDVDDGGGRLYIYTGDEWVDTSLPGAGDYLSVDQADDLYLSKTVDDTAAGAITFERQTTHEAGVKVTAGSIDVQSNVSITGSSFISGAPQAAIRLGDNQGNNSDIGSWTNLIANTGKLQVVSRQDSSGGGSWWEFQMEPGNAKNMYQFVGVHSGTEERIKLGTNGDAYFKGDVIFGPQPNKTDILNGSQNGKFIQRTDANLISARSAVVGNTHASFINPNGVVGYIKTINSNLVIEGLAGGPLLLDADADARKVTSTEEISNASAVVQQLQPVKINGTRHGFHCF